MSIKSDIKSEVESALEALGMRDPGIEVLSQGWSTAVVAFQVGGSEFRWVVPTDPDKRPAELGRMTDYLLKEAEAIVPIPMAIHTIKDAIAATEQGLASCYGWDEQGGAWVGFGRPRRTGHIPRVYLPASAAEVERCQHVQRRYLRHLKREAKRPVVIHPGVSPGDVSAEPEAVRPANDAEHDGGEGPRGASAATVEAEVRRACAAYPEIGAVVFEYDLCSSGKRHMVANGYVVHVVGDTFDDLRLGARDAATTLLYRHRLEQRDRTCGVCKGAYSLLCHACKGGVGS